MDTVPLESLSSAVVSAAPVYNIADIDGDGDVDGFDLDILGLAYGKRSTSADWGSTTVCDPLNITPCSAADLDGSGRVDGGALFLLRINFGN